jgi:hypothetical protein
VVSVYLFLLCVVAAAGGMEQSNRYQKGTDQHIPWGMEIRAFFVPPSRRVWKLFSVTESLY